MNKKDQIPPIEEQPKKAATPPPELPPVKQPSPPPLKIPQPPFDTSKLVEGDMVALKVLTQHHVPGQPCLGKIMSFSSNRKMLAVHYYMGKYDNVWKPMMSRNNPYIRQLPMSSVVCTFFLQADGRMSKQTAKLVQDRTEHM